MPGLVSYEYLEARLKELPRENGTCNFLGEFASSVELVEKYPAGNIADYAWSVLDGCFWYWNGGSLVPKWVRQPITRMDYIALTDAEKAAVPYIVTG